MTTYSILKDKEVYKQRAREFIEAFIKDQQNDFGSIRKDLLLEEKLAEMFYRYDQLQQELADHKRSSELAVKIGVEAAIKAIKENNGV